MTVKALSVNPTNSLLLFMDAQAPQIPESMGGKAVAATDSCIAVGTREEYGGPIELRIASADEGINLPALEIYDGVLRVTSGSLAVANIFGKQFVRWPLNTSSVSVRIYTNHSTEPDEIVVLVG